jgi:predicted AlkP superfamily pyrophosphatase or phosphodiesterase
MRFTTPFVLLPLAAAACVPRAPALPVPVDARTAHVVIVSIDGLRPDALEAAPAPNLLRLRAEGARAREARTVLPSHTLPSHTSMLAGVPPGAHGITWNDDRVSSRGTVAVPTVFTIARDHGLRTSAFFGKAKFRHLVLPAAPHDVAVPRGSRIVLAPEVVQQVEHHLRFHRPNLLFVHLADPDLAGHAMTWSSPAYRWAVRRADAAVERVRRAAVEAFGEDFVLIVTADHGGEGRGHGSEAEDDVLIPWIAWGRGVRTGEIDRVVQTTATASTALWLLGLPIPAGWGSRPVVEAFVR